VNLVSNYFRELRRGIGEGWNRFWFSPADPATLGLIRILAGAMLFYVHLVWTLGLNDFFGPHPWVSREVMKLQPGYTPFMWSYFDWIGSPALLWTVHILALMVFALLTVGLWSRTMSVLAFIATVSYANRASLAQFGLDDTMAMIALYLMVGPCGSAYSVDRLLKRRKAGGTLPIEPSIGANLAIRLLQVHLCVVYLFSGIGKVQGENWLNGNAILMVAANQEYQSLDLTWLFRYPYVASILANITVFWETFYCALVWPRLTRPIVIAIAFGVHLGIGMFLGMWTFGLAMIIANLSFVSPWVVRRLLDRQQSSAPPQSKISGKQKTNGGRIAASIL
jgi:hypothetical protein